jgi:hypothetical protein
LHALSMGVGGDLFAEGSVFLPNQATKFD